LLPGGRSVAKILVADDNSNIQKMVGLALKDQGIDVVAVGNGEAAVRKISDVRPDLVLADVFMPVRNGYEVCRYVKEDSSLSHIPVILLVGAFDPLDEQEAQRVGADGVLKKPFVPPDPLISMVKAALTRAGVSFGPAPTAEKPAAAARRSSADILKAGASSKLAALPPEHLPEATPEPLEEFPAPPPQVKIAEGKEPLAFGNLLETPEAEDAPVFSSKPMINLAQARKWNEEPDEVEEEKEEVEESPRSGWRSGGLDKDLERAAASSKEVPDWRDEAFHGSSPAKSVSPGDRAPALDRPHFAEAAESQSVAVTTVATKPAEAPVPFSGDAWAAAITAGAEEKLAAVKDIARVAPEIESLTPGKVDLAHELLGSAAAVLEGTAIEAKPAAKETKPAEPANWAAVPETTWELEAKKASLLASTWDAPKAPPSADDTQDVLVDVPEKPAAEVPTLQTEAPADASAYSCDLEASAESFVHVEVPANIVEALVNETPSEPAFEVSKPKSLDNVWETPAAVPEDAAIVAEVSEPKSWDNVWETPAAVPEDAAIVADEGHAGVSHVEEHPPMTAPPEEAVAAQPAQPDMDELVARVLGKMNPEVLQRVTREILKPVIEAIVRDELDSKKP
jgi:CheY-like chemotaxis protein